MRDPQSQTGAVFRERFNQVGSARKGFCIFPTRGKYKDIISVSTVDSVTIKTAVVSVREDRFMQC